MSGLIGWVPVSDDAAVASARIRCFNPLAELQRRGYPVELYRQVAVYRAVVFSKKYDAAALVEAGRLKAAGTRVVFDLCDNHFHNPTGSERLKSAAERLRSMLCLADDLVASTSALAEVIRTEEGTGRPVTVIGDAVEPWGEQPDGASGRSVGALERWLARSAAAPVVRFVWFGNARGPYGPGGMRDLLKIADPLRRLAGAGKVVPRLTVISNSRAEYLLVRGKLGVEARYVAWEAGSFAAAMRLHHVALVPVTPTPYTLCKSNNRVATALALGLAVIADPIPSYEEFRPFVSLGDWDGGLELYSAEPARLAAVLEGRQHVERHWAIGPVADQWQAFFDRLQRD